VTDYHHSAHAVWDIKYHLVWITKYRYKVLRGEVAERARSLLRQICAAREVRIVRGGVSPEHVHMLVVVPPQLAPAKLVQFLKRRSSRMLQGEFPHLRKRYCGQQLWARGYFCATVGAIDEQTVMRYIESQKWDQDDDGFKITAPTEP
jgi:putative transposase